MGWLVSSISGLLLLAGALFVLIGAVGVLRLPDFFTRLHAASVIDTMGTMLIIAGLILWAGFSIAAIKLILILLFILFTTPTAAHALAKASLHGGLRPQIAPDVTHD